MAIMEGMKPKAEWDNMQSLTAQLGNLTNYMNRLEGKMTDQEEAQAIADRVLAEEAAAKKAEEAQRAARLLCTARARYILTAQLVASQNSRLMR